MSKSKEMSLMTLDLEAQEAEEIFVLRTFMTCSSPNIIRIYPCQEGLGSIPVQPLWGLWHWDIILSEFSGFLPVSIIMPVFHTHSLVLTLYNLSN
jgi:hypothetical protein